MILYIVGGDKMYMIIIAVIVLFIVSILGLCDAAKDSRCAKCGKVIEEGECCCKECEK